MENNSPKNVQKFAPQARGMVHPFAPRFPHICPTTLSAGQNTLKHKKTNTKTPCPAWGKCAGQAYLFTHLPHASLSLGRGRWGKELGRKEFNKEISI